MTDERRIPLAERTARALRAELAAALAAQAVAQATAQAAQQIADRFNARLRMVAEANGVEDGEDPRFDDATGALVLVKLPTKENGC